MKIKEILANICQESFDIVHSFEGSLNEVHSMLTYLRLTETAIMRFDKNSHNWAVNWLLKHPNDTEKISTYIEELKEKLRTICGIRKQ